MANSEGSDNMLNRVMPKDNIGLAALIKTKEAAWENGEYIIVACTRLRVALGWANKWIALFWQSFVPINLQFAKDTITISF